MLILLKITITQEINIVNYIANGMILLKALESNKWKCNSFWLL